jgi:RNA polymerase sigma-70 factor (ECF subfamily)
LLKRTNATGDNLLLKRAIHQRDRYALRLLYARYYAPLKRYIASRTHSPAQAEDLAQNLFVHLCQRNGKPNYDCQNAEAYLFGIARNLIRQHHRNAERSPKPLDTPTLEAIAADRRRPTYPARLAAEPDDTQDLVLEALNRLPPAARQALKLAIIDDLPAQQAARKARCSVDAFYKRLSRARKAITRLLKYQRQAKK